MYIEYNSKQMDKPSIDYMRRLKVPIPAALKDEYSSRQPEEPSINYMRRLKVPIPAALKDKYKGHETLRFGVHYKKKSFNCIKLDPSQKHYLGTITISLCVPNSLRSDIRHLLIYSINELEGDSPQSYINEVMRIARNEETLVDLLK